MLDLILQLANLLIGLAPVALVCYLLVREGTTPSAAIGLDAREPGRDLAKGAVLAAVIGGSGLLLYIAAFKLGLALNVVPENLPAVWWRIPVLILQAARNGILEEILVLGYLLRRLDQLGLSPARAIAISAVVRGSYHLYQGFGGFLGNAVMGVIFALLYLRWKPGHPVHHRARPDRHRRVRGLRGPARPRLLAPLAGGDVGQRGALGRRAPAAQHEVRVQSLRVSGPGLGDGSAGVARPMTGAPGGRRAPGSTSFERRRPLPITTAGVAATRASTRIGHAAGRPTGVIPPYSIPVSATATSIGANDALRTSSSRRAAPLTSARVVASTTQAANLVSPPRRPLITTQLADSAGSTP